MKRNHTYLSLLGAFCVLASGACGSSTKPKSTTSGTATGSSTGSIAAGAAGAVGAVGAVGATGVTSATMPSIASTNPVDGATGVAVNRSVTITFNQGMDPNTITANTFTVSPSSGVVKYDPLLHVATFTPNTNFGSNTTFTAQVGPGVKDANQNSLPQVMWHFTTGATSAAGPAPVLLGSAGDYVILAQSAITNVTGSAVTGNLGISPAAATYVTGFALSADATNTFANSSSVVGKVYAATYAPPTPANLTTAVGWMQTAYTDAAGRVTPDFTELGSGNIGGKNLVPGLYKWSTSVTIPTDVTLSGGANDVWIFQIAGDVVVSAAKKVILVGGAQPKNIFWQLAGQMTVGTTAHMEGVVLSKTAITLNTTASINGRLLAQTAVALDNCTVTNP